MGATGALQAGFGSANQMNTHFTYGDDGRLLSAESFANNDPPLHPAPPCQPVLPLRL